MKRLSRFTLLVAFYLLGIFTPAAQPQDPPSKDEIAVLFIGNSFTYFHDLPKMLAELAKAGKQPKLIYERETPGGCTLEKHWKDGKALAKIQSRKWDFVVLQEQSQAPLLKRDSMFDHAKKFDAEIKKQGAKTILYMTWALQNKPEDQATISKAYLDLSKELRAQVAPVGNAWESALKADKTLVLHEKDTKHPNSTGTYVAACVFYATIYGKSLEGLPGSIGKLTDDEARPLQVIAWKAVQGKENKKSMRTLEHFQKSLDKTLTPEKTVATFGEPDRKLGSGLIIYEYDLEDGTKLRLGFPGFAPIQYAHHVQRDGKSADIPVK